MDLRNTSEVGGGLLNIAERICWGWAGWTAGEVVWISGRISGRALGTGWAEEELQDGWG